MFKFLLFLCERVKEGRGKQNNKERTFCLCCSLILLIAQGKDLSALVNLPQSQYKAPRSLFPCLAHRIKLSCPSNRQHRESLVQLSCLTDRHFSPIMGVCRHRPASIDTVSGLRGDALISQDTLNIDLTSCRNDPLVLVKDHCLSRLALMHLECCIVMETIITRRARQELSLEVTMDCGVPVRCDEKRMKHKEDRIYISTSIFYPLSKTGVI